MRVVELCRSFDYWFGAAGLPLALIKILPLLIDRGAVGYHLGFEHGLLCILRFDDYRLQRNVVKPNPILHKARTGTRTVRT